MDFDIFPYQSKAELNSILKNVSSKNDYTLVTVGRLFDKTHLRQVSIINRESDIRRALLTAANICETQKKVKEKAVHLNAIVNYFEDGVVALDGAGLITAVNYVAGKLLQIDPEKTVGVAMDDIFQTLSLSLEDPRLEEGHIISIQGRKNLVQRILIGSKEKRSGIIFTFREVSRIQKLEHQIRKKLHQKGLVARYEFDHILGASTAIRRCIQKARKMAETSATVLISGETGCGKELFAQSIHNSGPRKKNAFVAVNCSALPPNLLESELFGYEEGAFTGARKGGKAGLFELAHTGTIFLDEIGEIPLHLQSRLLRVLQEKEVFRLGGDAIFHVDVRIIAATNLNLFEQVRQGRFRQDLYYRLSILNLTLPPLNFRREDIPDLVTHFMEKLTNNQGLNLKRVSSDAMAMLCARKWPGNIRELENFVEKMLVLAETDLIPVEFVSELILEDEQARENLNPVSSGSAQLQNRVSVPMGTLAEMERELVRSVYHLLGQDKAQSANILGISRTTLWKRLKEIDLQS